MSESRRMRGKRLGHDEIEPWEYEVQDTYGVMDWISKQPGLRARGAAQQDTGCGDLRQPREWLTR